MLYALLGTVEEKREVFFVLRTGGMFFKVLGGKRMIEGLSLGREMKIFTSLRMKEGEVWEVYGFLNEEDVRVFETLDGVSGVGPRTALLVLDCLGSKGIAVAVAEKEADFFAKVPGVGRRSAERMVLELQGKFAVLDSGELSDLMKIDIEIEGVLAGLGYRKEDAREVLRGFGKTPGKLEERLKRALKEISKR